MENASKALIIAGAILLAILIIGLGITVYNNASSSTSSADLTSQEISAHNSQFTSYEGKQKGTNVSALITSIKVNNKNYQDRMIKITFSASTVSTKVKETDIAKYTESATEDENTYNYDVKSSTTYYVTFAKSDTGFIQGVNIHIYSDNDL